VIDAAALHRAAERVWSESGTPAMDRLASAGAQFIRESLVTDEYEVPFVLDTKSLGYGIMLGYLAARAEARER
jgi:predicted ABC-type ATPase